MRFARAHPVVLLLLAGVAGFGACSPNSVCKLAGPINDPSNRTLRRNLMSFGLGQFCTQMITRSAPLKLTPDAPIIGRFTRSTASRTFSTTEISWSTSMASDTRGPTCRRR